MEYARNGPYLRIVAFRPDAVHLSFFLREHSQAEGYPRSENTHTGCRRSLCTPCVPAARLPACLLAGLASALWCLACLPPACRAGVQCASGTDMGGPRGRKTPRGTERERACAWTPSAAAPACLCWPALPGACLACACLACVVPVLGLPAARLPEHSVGRTPCTCGRTPRVGPCPRTGAASRRRDHRAGA